MDAQLIAAATFVAHARAWRSGRAAKPQYASLAAFRHAHDLYFDTPVGLVIPGRERFRPKNVSRWLDWIPRAGPRDLRVGVVGGVIRRDDLADLAAVATFSPFRFTVVDTRGKRSAWVSERAPVTALFNRRGLWIVRFRHIDDASVPPDLSVADATTNLRAILLRVAEHARGERRLEQWVPSLEHASAVLDGLGPARGAFDVFPPQGYTEQAARLVTAAHYGWVLGGEGTWSDYEPRSRHDGQQHRAMAAELYACLIEAVISATNNGLAA